MATVTKRKWKTSKGETREAWTLAFTDASGIRRKEQFSKKREADARRVEVEGQVKSGTFRADASNTTVDDAVSEYIKYLTGRRDRGERVTEHYLRTTESQLHNYVSPQADRPIDFDGGLGALKLSQLTARSVGDFRDRLRAAGVGIVTTRRIIGSLSRVLNHAVGNDLIAINPASKVRVIGKRDEGPKKVVPPSKEVLSLLFNTADIDFAIKLKFAATTGLRASEMHALRWDRINLKGRTVVVDARVDVYGNLDTTKSDAGIRTIPIAKQLAADLKSWRLRSKFAKDTDLVFPDTKGGYVQHGNMLKRSFRPLLEKVCLSEKVMGRSFEPFGWHALRHFAISTWIEADLQPKTIQTFAGHSTLAVTMSRYGHMFKSENHSSAMDKIADAIFSSDA